MGQAEVLEILREIKKENPVNPWVSASVVKERLEKKGFGRGTQNKVYDHLFKLTLTNQAKAKGSGMWNYRVLFRAV